MEGSCSGGLQEWQDGDMGMIQPFSEPGRIMGDGSVIGEKRRAMVYHQRKVLAFVKFLGNFLGGSGDASTALLRTKADKTVGFITILVGFKHKILYPSCKWEVSFDILGEYLL